MVVPPVVLLVPLFVFGVHIGWISTFRLVILIYVGLMLPFSVYLLANFFRTIPRSLIEAATIDGASSWDVFRQIVLPLSAAPIVTLAVVNLLWVWNELLIALVFLQDDSKKTLMVGITGFQSRYSLNVPVIMSGLMLATLPIVALYLFGQRYFRARARLRRRQGRVMADRLTIRAIETIPIRVPLDAYLPGQLTTG